MSSATKFVLRVPLDASRVPDFQPDRSVSVLAWHKQGVPQQRLAAFNPQGKGSASFEFQQPPESLRVALGPETATPADLQRLQTISVAVPSSTWQTGSEVSLPAIQISSYHWWWWQHWRQNFKVTGRVLSARGIPIIGATVSAFDIDAWWWWTAQEQVGRATTDAEGCFVIDFARGCGWWPWWWWVTRDWQANSALVDQITAFVRQYPRFAALGAPTPAPSLDVFQALLASSPRPMPARFSSSVFQSGQTIATTAIDPASLEGLRERLIEILPKKFPLPIWPWSAWSPWEDCGANVLFKVTETCADQTTVLLNETISEARWDIPSSLDVTLTARDGSFRERAPGWTLVDYLFPAKLGRAGKEIVVPPGRLA
ncbi:MAG: carboxypeptidase-like regulatory domain-containing protein [Acidobacteriaceae bacterium]